MNSFDKKVLDKLAKAHWGERWETFPIHQETYEAVALARQEMMETIKDEIKLGQKVIRKVKEAIRGLDNDSKEFKEAKQISKGVYGAIKELKDLRSFLQASEK